MVPLSLLILMLIPNSAWSLPFTVGSVQHNDTADVEECLPDAGGCRSSSPLLPQRAPDAAEANCTTTAQTGELRLGDDCQTKEARGYAKRVTAVLAPLILGFSLAALIISALTAVKLFLLKTLLLSKVALLAALFLAAYKLLHAPYRHEPLPYHPHELPYYYYGDYGHGYELPEAAPATGHDLQAQYSGQATSVQDNVQKNDTTKAPGSSRRGSSAVSVVRGHADRSPVAVYRKVVSVGRSAFT